MGGMFPMGESSGGGGGVDLAALGWVVLDFDDGTWTAYDPSSKIKSVTTDGTGLTTATMEAHTSNNAFAPSAGSSSSWGRRYKLLRDTAGALIEGGDTYTVEFLIDATDTDKSVGSEFVVGLCTVPESTTPATVESYGLSEAHAAGANIRFAAHVENASTSTSASATHGMAQVMESSLQVSYVNIISWNATTTKGASSRNPNITRADGESIYLVAGWGPSTTGTLAEDALIKHKAYYRVTRRV